MHYPKEFFLLIFRGIHDIFIVCADILQSTKSQQEKPKYNSSILIKLEIFFLNKFFS